MRTHPMTTDEFFEFLFYWQLRESFARQRLDREIARLALLKEDWGPRIPQALLDHQQRRVVGARSYYVVQRAVLLSLTQDLRN
jgi:hypothetical protein